MMGFLTKHFCRRWQLGERQNGVDVGLQDADIHDDMQTNEAQKQLLLIREPRM